jgi:hypothetical protein
MTDFWNINAFSLATTMGVAYIFCAIFDILFPPFGMIVALARPVRGRFPVVPSVS